MKAIRPFSILVVLCLACGAPVMAQSGDFTLSLLPSVSVPLGPTLEDGLPFYSIGGGGGIRGELAPGFARWLFGRASIEYEFLPLNGSDSTVSFVTGGGSLGASFSPSPRFALRASAGGGLYMALSELGTVRNPFMEGGAELLFRLSPAFSAGLGARYKYFMAPGESPY